MQTSTSTSEYEKIISVYMYWAMEFITPPAVGEAEY